MTTVLTVSQINTYLKSVIDGDSNLQNIYVAGEISNFTNHYRTGHFYFTLKDERAALKAVMFRTSAQRLRFLPEDGMRVIIRGNLSLFERDGVYQLYCEDMQPDGAGALSVAFEQLKKKLAAMGLFDPEHKKPIPALPGRIGVITSPTGAAVHDIQTVLERRFPLAEIIFAPVQVQGELAAPQICEAIAAFNRKRAADVLIVGRGGGSAEDLWAFNEELVAHAVFESEIPVISAVGHETDTTIIDFVADIAAPTPSAAAELAVPDRREVLFELDKQLDELQRLAEGQIDRLQSKVQQAAVLLQSRSPESYLSACTHALSVWQTRLNADAARKVESDAAALAVLAEQLELSSPLKTMKRGYALVRDRLHQPVRKALGLQPGEEISLCFTDGDVQCTVNSVRERINGKDGSEPWNNTL